MSLRSLMKTGKEAVARAAQLIEDLKSDDKAKRKESVENLGVIAKALGSERTRIELIPYLKGKSMQSNQIRRTSGEVQKSRAH